MKNSYFKLLCNTFCVIMCVLLLAFLFSITLTETVYAGENIWTWTGVNGCILQIATDPINPGVVYINIGNSQIKKSMDNGNTWITIFDSFDQEPYKGYISQMAMAPSAPNTLYVLTETGIYRTTNGGNTWQNLTNLRGLGIAVSPVDWKEVYIVGSHHYKSTDGGSTWIEIGEELPRDNYSSYNGITIAPSAPHILIIKPTPGFSQFPLYKSTDSGQSWTSLGNFDDPGIGMRHVTFDPTSSNIIYVGTSSPGGWKSVNGGTTWQPLANGLQQNTAQFIVDPDNTQIVYAANWSAGIFESLDGGASWTSLNNGIQGLQVESIGIASRDPLEMYAGLCGGGLWKMTRTTIKDYSITINDGSLFTNQVEVTLTLTAPPGTTQMMISNDGGFGGATWESFAAQKPWTITSYGSYVLPRIVYAKFKTNGQISGVYQDDIILDQTPPTGTIQITDTIPATTEILATTKGYSSATLSATTMYTVYLPLATKNYLPGFRLVGLSLSATDDVSGVDNMLISNAITFTGAQWQAYVQKLNWYVNEKGTTTIYIKYRDRAGNESQVYSTSTIAP